MLAVEALAGTAVRYRLAPWEHGHAIRRIERYDEASERGRNSARRRAEAASGRRVLAILFSPLLGHAPGAVQTRMESEFGAPALALTVVSALPLFVAGLWTMLAARIAGFGGPPIVPEWMLDYSGLFTYLAFESALRLYSALVLREPMGSLAGWLAHAAWVGLGGPSGGPAIPAAARASAPPAERALQDRYTMLEPLLSLLPPADQEALERRFAFDPLRWGRRSSLAILLFAGANALISVAAFLSRTDTLLDFVSLVLGGFLAVEQLGRRRKIAEGKPAGSVLGVCARPLARPLLDAARS